MNPIAPIEAPIELFLVRPSQGSAAKASLANSAPRRSRAAKGQPRHSVLVVDDDADVRELLAAVLKSEGYDVLTAENGAAALSVLRETLPDLIVLDLMMPVMNGWEFRGRRSAPTLSTRLFRWSASLDITRRTLTPRRLGSPSAFRNLSTSTISWRSSGVCARDCRLWAHGFWFWRRHGLAPSPEPLASSQAHVRSSSPRPIKTDFPPTRTFVIAELLLSIEM